MTITEVQNGWRAFALIKQIVKQFITSVDTLRIVILLSVSLLQLSLLLNFQLSSLYMISCAGREDSKLLGQLLKQYCLRNGLRVIFR